MVRGFVEKGCRVSACARSGEAVASLQKEYGPEHTFLAVDVTDEAAVLSFATAAGAPDLLLNNAATINRKAPLWKVSGEEFSNVIDVNIKGVANCIRYFVPLMIEKSSGVIVNFSSGWGRSTSPDAAPYCATKWAIEGLTQALAQELPVGMAAVPLNPGIINTEMLQSRFGGSASSYRSPEEWAETAVPFLLKLNARSNGRSLTAP